MQDNTLSFKEFDFQTLQLKPDDIIVVKFNTDEILLEEAHRIFNSLQQLFPNNEVIGMIKGVDIETKCKDN